VFKGRIPAAQTGTFPGEVVFTTGMTGYVESLTDPSYAGQILVFTYPMIGNYGVLREEAWESEKIRVAGLITSELCEGWSHARATQPLLEWLTRERIPLFTGVDTRALTKYLRTRGVMQGAIAPKALRLPLPPLQIPFISIPEPRTYGATHEPTVVLVDCGAKENILRSLLTFPVRVKRVPYDYDYSKEPFAGVVISNGPGDPADYKETIVVAHKAMRRGLPMFGICLGSQIMGLAAGATTYKLPFGHRGHNQPVSATSGAHVPRSTRRCFITSQNHGYAVDAATLPSDWQVTFRNLNDQSVEGLAHKTKPFFSVQFHPEASPGPTDTAWLFDRFFKAL
jgi:carbamoyl-phosphate synthase small subunit